MKKLVTLFTMAFAMLFSTTTYAQCDPPTNPASSYSNNVSTFTWDAIPGAVGYRFQFKFQWGSWNSVPLDEMLTTNSYSLTGLFQSAPFEWRVSTDCGGMQSAFSPVQSYATPCPQPSGLTVTNIAGTSATLNWIAAPGYNTTTSDFVVSYRLANTTNAWTSLGHTSGFSMNVTGLLSNTMYEWCVNQSCMYSLSNPVISQFTTLYIACNIPTNLNVTNATATQATVSWTGVSGGLTYSVQYKPVTSNTWSAPVNSNTTSLILNGLTSSTLYDCRVKANCSGATSSYITKQFTTYSATCASYGVNTSEWIDYFSLGSITRASGAEIGGYYKSSMSANLIIGSANNSVTISAGYKPGIVFGEYYAVYIDFNRNGNFGDAGERVVAPLYISSGSNYSTTFNVPGNVTPGPTKMRVILRRSGTSIVPCATGFSGETEDYDVSLASSLRVVNNNAVTIAEDKTETSITVSPNPSDGIFAISLPNIAQPAFYEVVNMNGLRVQKQNVINDGQFVVDLTRMSKGLYLLKITDQSGKQQVHKLLKN